MRLVDPKTVTRDGIEYLDFDAVSVARNGTAYTAHVTISLDDLHRAIVQASENKTRRTKRGPVRLSRAHASPPAVIEGSLATPALPAAALP